LEALPAYTNLAEVPISTPTEESTKKTSQETPLIQARSVSCSTSLENLELEALTAYTNHAEVPIYKPRLTTKPKSTDTF